MISHVYIQWVDLSMYLAQNTTVYNAASMTTTPGPTQDVTSHTTPFDAASNSTTATEKQTTTTAMMIGKD